MDNKLTELKDDADRGWPFWKLVLIALPHLTICVFWSVLMSNSTVFLMRLGMSPSLATINNLAGPVTGFFTSPLAAAFSDSMVSPYGRRRPVILAGLMLTWVAAMLFASSERIMPSGFAIFLAAPMFWVLDVTANIMMTPNRALVADLAAPEQQMSVQVTFAVVSALGGFIAFSIMRIYDLPASHMLELLTITCMLHTVLVGVQFSVARERPAVAQVGAERRSLCAPAIEALRAMSSSPPLVKHLALIQCVLSCGYTAWGLYGGQWFSVCVFRGDLEAPEDSRAHRDYLVGQAQFAFAGQCKQLLLLVSSLLIMAILRERAIRPALLYAICLAMGALASGLAPAVPAYSNVLARSCMMLSALPCGASQSVSFGLIGAYCKTAEQRGEQPSTALYMAVLNCALTIGQQVCTIVLAALEGVLTISQSLPVVFALAALAEAFASISALNLDDGLEEHVEKREAQDHILTAGSDVE